jgi:hypothetical protein
MSELRYNVGNEELRSSRMRTVTDHKGGLEIIVRTLYLGVRDV